MPFSESYKGFEIRVEDQKYLAYNAELNYMLFDITIEGTRKRIDAFYLEK